MRRFARARDPRLEHSGRLASLGMATFLAAALALPVAAQEGEGPPEDWRPEEYPRDALTLERPSADEAERGVHEVRRGDTLWDLAGHYLADPFLWPDIYRLNTHIVEDPHWIYPGERLSLPADATRVAGRGTAAPEGGRTATAASPPAETRSSPSRPATAARGVSRFGGPSVFDQSPRSADRLGDLAIESAPPSPLVGQSDFYRAAFLAERESLGPLATTARKLEGNPLDLTLPSGVKLHDRVVLTLNGLAAQRGDVLQAVRLGRRVAEHGQIVHSMALLRVTEVDGDSARAVVTRVFGNYRVGDPVLVAERFDGDVPSTRQRAAASLTTRVVGTEVEQALLVRGNFVFLNVGESEGVSLGDEFVLFPRHEQDVIGARWEDRQAVARVMRVRDGTATAMIVDIHDVGAATGSPARLAYRAGGDF